MRRSDEQPHTSDLAHPVTEDELQVEGRADATAARGNQDGDGDPIVLEDDSGSTSDEAMTLVEERDRQTFLSRWKEIQSEFVDEPRGAVSHADGLVAELMQHLARTFADVRADLEDQWERKEDVSTEDLRVALQRYRTFFRRLLET